VKRWLITGCSGGLGRALAFAALARGDAVAGTSRGAGLELGVAAVRWIPLQLDVTDPPSVRACVDAAADQLDGLDIVVNNAGFALSGAVEEIAAAEAQAQFAVNFFGPLQVIQAALPHLRGSCCGRILNIASFAAIQGLPGLGLYSAAKAALAGLSEALAVEASDMGVRVTVVEPTGFRTNFAGGSLGRTQRPRPEYDALRARQEEGFARSDGRQPNDPVKGAQSLLALADLPDPPLHFALGFDAETRITSALQRRLQEYRAFAALGADTRFADEAWAG
jgi:NAD(P)-dependent dehydrogenase (short-subunit alcohol dehydrogenase family)